MSMSMLSLKAMAMAMLSLTRVLDPLLQGLLQSANMQRFAGHTNLQQEHTSKLLCYTIVMQCNETHQSAQHH